MPSNCKKLTSIELTPYLVGQKAQAKDWQPVLQWNERKVGLVSESMIMLLNEKDIVGECLEVEFP